MTQIINDFYEQIKQASVTDILMFLLFCLLMTLLISSQNFFFQRIIENGISKRDIIADKTITVIVLQEVIQEILLLPNLVYYLIYQPSTKKTICLITF